MDKQQAEQKEGQENVPADLPDEAATKETPVQDPQFIPYGRFAQLYKEKKEAEERIAALEAAEAARQRKKAEEEGNYQQIIAELEPKAKRAAELEKAFKTVLEAELESIPEDKRDLIPDGDVTTQLEWLQKAKKANLFGARPAPETDAGKTGERPGTITVKLTPLQVSLAEMANMTLEEYVASMQLGQPTEVVQLPGPQEE